MRRVNLILGVLLCALTIPTSAIGARPSAAAAASAGRQVRGQATGTITALGGSWFTIQTSGRRIGVINALIAAADGVRRGNYSYVWGGGHEEAGVPTRAGRKLGYDCSGAVAAALAGAGLWSPGSPVPNDAGVIAQLKGEHLIARGAGTAPTEVTLYDHPGVHIFMNIDGRFFGTSDGGGGGSPKGGPGWLYDGAWDAYNRAFKQYHILPSVLRDKTTYGHTLTFQTNDWSLLQAFALGDRVQVNYTSRGSGIMVARSLTWAGAVTTAGEVSSVSADGSTFSILTPRGRALSFSSGSALQTTGELALGETVQVTYTKGRGKLLARLVNVTAQPVVSQITGSVSSIGSGLGSFAVQTSDGRQLSFSTAGDTSLLQDVQVGENLDISYVQVGPILIVQTLSPSSGDLTPGNGATG